jgi:hypothetical protein
MLPKRLAPGKSAKVKVRVGGKCLAAVEEGQVGLAVIEVEVAGAPRKQMLLLEARLWSGKRAAEKARGS